MRISDWSSDVCSSDLKERWVAEHFPGTQIITCMAVDKRRHAQAGDILVDDTLKHRHLWEEAGGTFVHHRNAKDTLAELRALGLPVREPPEVSEHDGSEERRVGKGCGSQGRSRWSP